MSNEFPCLTEHLTKLSLAGEGDAARATVRLTLHSLALGPIMVTANSRYCDDMTKSRDSKTIRSPRGSVDTVSSVSAKLFLLGSLGVLSSGGLLAGTMGCSLKHERVDTAATDATLMFLEAEYGRVSSPDLQIALSRVSKRLAEAHKGLEHFPEYKNVQRLRVRDLPWQVFVVGDTEVNAFALGSGVLVLTEGMVRALDTESKLAAVLAHEMAHELLGHTIAARVRNAQATESEVHQHYDPAQELAADRLGTLLLHAAGYEPESSLDALLSVSAASADPSLFLSQDRLIGLRDVISSLPDNRPYILNSRQYNKARRSVLSLARVQ